MAVLKTPLQAVTRKPYWWAYASGVLLLVVSAWLWWTFVYLSPSQVFWGTLENNLATRSVTVQTTQNNGDRKVSQIVQFELGTVQKAHSLTDLTQAKTRIQSEVIGTPHIDYSRYRSIVTEEKNAAGKPLDVSKVVGVWARSDSNQQQSTTQQSGHQLFAQALLGIGLQVGSVPFPIADLPAAKRNELLHDIHEQGVYRTSFKSVAKTHKHGRLLYTYNVKIQSLLYVRLMKTVAAELGLHELDQVEPNDYQNNEDMTVGMVVDARSRQLVAITHADGPTQEYMAYGAKLPIQLPDEAISAYELQQRLKSL